MPNLEDLLAKAMAGGGGGGSAAADNPPVYMGSTTRSNRIPLNRMQPTPPQARNEHLAGVMGLPAAKRDYGHGTTTVGNTSSLQAEINRLYEDDKYADKVRKRLVAAGLLKPELARDMDSLETAWGAILTTSAKYLDNGRKLTPWDVLELRTKGSGKQKMPPGYSSVTGQMLPGWTTGANGSPVFAPYGLDPETGKPKSRIQTSSSTSSSVNDVSDGDAWAIMQNAAANALGREVSHEEVREFAYRANQIAAENPDEVTSTQTVDAATGDSATSTKRKSGWQTSDTQRMAQEDLEDTPEAGAYQAATTYYNAMLGALDSPVDI